MVWMGDRDRIATTGFSKMSDRQVAIWDTGDLSNVKTITIDQTSGVLMPFWTDNNILFLGTPTPAVLSYYVTDLVIKLARVMAISATTNTRTTTSSPLLNTSRRSLSVACASSPVVASACRIARLRAP